MLLRGSVTVVGLLAEASLSEHVIPRIAELHPERLRRALDGLVPYEQFGNRTDYPDFKMCKQVLSAHFDPRRGTNCGGLD